MIKVLNYDLSVPEQLRFSNYFLSDELFRVWSAAIDLGNEEIFNQPEDIIFNKAETGKISRNLIKTLLNSEKKESLGIGGKTSARGAKTEAVAADDS